MMDSVVRGRSLPPQESPAEQDHGLISSAEQSQISSAERGAAIARREIFGLKKDVVFTISSTEVWSSDELIE